jgi:hypothetical protein
MGIIKYKFLLVKSVHFAVKFALHLKRRLSPWVLGACLVLLAGRSAWASVTSLADMELVHDVEDAEVEHADQDELRALVASSQEEEAFEEAFELGDKLFGTVFNALDGGGANVGTGQRFTRVPRADLKGPGEWFDHTPIRVTGPNAAACISCHFRPFEDGAGDPAGNVHRDTFRAGVMTQFVQRNTPHLFAPGALQRLAEEMTEELHHDRQQLRAEACANPGVPQSQALSAKEINFGVLGGVGTGVPCVVVFDTSGVQGVDFAPNPQNPDSTDPDLVIKPFQWKGSVAFIRDFNRGASHNELGMQAVEIVGDDVDGDFDSVTNEFTIGDQTALAVYLAAQPRPTTLLELQELDLIDPLPSSQVAAINRGRQVFEQVGCATCHVPRLFIDKPIFSEPSQDANYRDRVFPAGQDPVARGVDPHFAVTFDLTRDQPDNIIRDRFGNIRARLGSFQGDGFGRAIVDLFGDLKRHQMGLRLAEPVNEIAGDDTSPNPTAPLNNHTPSTFLTENLWGVGSTAPYMHDGRATTIVEAILEHGTDDPADISEAHNSRRAYLGRSASDKKALVAFLENLVLFKVEEEEETDAATGQVTTKSVIKVAPKRVRLRIQGSQP